MVRIQSNLNNFSVLDELKKILLSFEKCCGYSLFLDKNGILRPDIKSCPRCKANFLHNGYNLTINKKAKKFGILPKKGKLQCLNCGFTITIPKKILDDWFTKYDNWIIANALSLISKGLSRKTANRVAETNPTQRTYIGNAEFYVTEVGGKAINKLNLLSLVQ
mgnify:CR=1 FL=1